MPLSAAEVEDRYPIHWLVWNNRHEELKEALESKKFTEDSLEKKDPRGRTPLLLAITLAHLEVVQVLLEAGADVSCEKDGWSAVQEATSTGDPELLSVVLTCRDIRRAQRRAELVPELLTRLSLAPDFYVEMKWEFTSWVPLVSRMCPFDTYKVYKRGANVRVDTTLVGFEQNKWQRGSITYIFRGKGQTAELTELDHTQRTLCTASLSSAEVPRVTPGQLRQRLRQPIDINYLDTEKISFERNKSGVWGWRQDKTESVSGYECKVFGASNVELVSKTRTEHVSKEHRSRVSSPRAPLAGLLSLADNDGEDQQQEAEDEETALVKKEEAENPITWEEYFSGEELGDRDIGRPKEVTTKIQKFKANLWLCENYPLELQEQIMPILDLMSSIASTHFAKLKDFIQMQLPSGFPVKIEIPIYHVLNARVTFGNIFATESPVNNVSSFLEEERLACIVDDECFAVPPDYRNVATLPCLHTDDGLMQYAIHQSLMDVENDEEQVDVWEALRNPGPVPSPQDPTYDILAEEDEMLQRAIEASLWNNSEEPTPEQPVTEQLPQVPQIEVSNDTDAVQQALSLSRQEEEHRQRMLVDEQRILDAVLRLSMVEQCHSSRRHGGRERVQALSADDGKP